MKILIINALHSGGGTEVQTQREKSLLLENGHDVFLITFDSNIGKNRTGNTFNIPYGAVGFKYIYYRNHINRGFYNEVKSIVDIIKPDIIHINNLQGNAYSVLEACKGYPVLKTIRDPGLICPKATCLLPNMKMCQGFVYGKCHRCIGMMLNYQIVAFQFSKLRKQYQKIVTQYICPSQYLADAGNANGFSTKCINNPFDFSIIKKKRPTHNKTFLYYGYISKDKGVKNLLVSFAHFHKTRKDAELLIAGKIGDISINEIEGYKTDGVRYLGVLPQKAIMDLYKSISCVVVPSVWLENYPNTVLEALACKTMVIGSNRGGIGELVGNKNFLFDALNTSEISDKLELIYSMDDACYNDIVENNYNRIINNNALDVFYVNILNVMNYTIKKFHGDI